MNNANPYKLLVCLIMLVILPGVDMTANAQNRQDDVTLETVGKENPFEMVTPKKNLIQRLRPSSRQPQPEEIYIEEVPDLFIETVMLRFLQLL